jgi:hypothetical protein
MILANVTRRVSARRAGKPRALGGRSHRGFLFSVRTYSRLDAQG